MSWRTQVSLLSSSAILRILAVNLRLGSSWMHDGCLCPDSMFLHKCIQRHEGQVALTVSFYWGGNLSQKCLSLFIGQDWVRSQALTGKEPGKWVCFFFFLAFSATRVGISSNHHRGNQVGEGLSVWRQTGLPQWRSLPLCMIQFYLKMSYLLECNSSRNCILSVSLIAFGRGLRGSSNARLMKPPLKVRIYFC